MRAQLRLPGLKPGAVVRCAVVVLGAARRADVERATALAGMLGDACQLVAAGGGLKACRLAHRAPDLYVGNSHSGVRLPRSVPAVILPAEDDRSDLVSALREVRRRDVEVVVVAGLMGDRLDLEWANVSELAGWSRSFRAILAPGPRGLVLVTRRGCRAATVPDRVVSLLALCGRATVTLRGTRWALTRRRLDPGSAGVSNITGRSVQLTVHAGAVGMIFPA